MTKLTGGSGGYGIPPRGKGGRGCSGSKTRVLKLFPEYSSLLVLLFHLCCYVSQ